MGEVPFDPAGHTLLASKRHQKRSIKKKMKMSSIYTITCFFALSILSWGAPITWNFSMPNGNQGATHTYIGSDGVSSITASAFSWAGGILSLDGKNSNDTGLGIVPHGYHNLLSVNYEIDTTDYIQLDLSKAGSGVISLVMTSVDGGGDSFDIYGVNKNGGLTKLIAQSTLNDKAFNISQYGFATIDVTAHRGDVLIGSASETTKSVTTATPEPSTYVMLGSALLGLGLLRRKPTA
jgi:hypothetical protein